MFLLVPGLKYIQFLNVFDEESESEVENLEILHPDLEIQEIRKNVENPYFLIFDISLVFRGGVYTRVDE